MQKCYLRLGLAALGALAVLAGAGCWLTPHCILHTHFASSYLQPGTGPGVGLSNQNDGKLTHILGHLW